MAKHLYKSALFVTVIYTLSACGGQESSIPERETLTPPVGNTGSSASTLNGRVMDGYLRHARVWLDINENFQLDEGEPNVMSRDGGRFSFTKSMMGDLGSPRQYRMMAHVLPGISVDEDDMVGENEALGIVEEGYILSSPPGNPYITPLTTLIVAEYDYLQRRDGIATYGSAHNRVRTRVGLESDLLQDYVSSENYVLHSLAKSLITVQQELYNGQNMVVEDNLLSQVDGDVADMTAANLLRASAESLTGFAEWALQGSPEEVTTLRQLLQSEDDLKALNFDNFRTELEHMGLVDTSFDNPAVLSEQKWYVSSNSTSRQRTDSFLNTAYYFPIPSSAQIDSNYQAPELADLIPNSKLTGHVQFSRFADERVSTARIDGGVDYYNRYTYSTVPSRGEAVIIPRAFHKLFSTEILEADGEWDLISSVVLEDLNPDPEIEEAGAGLAVHRFPENPSLTELTALYVDPDGESYTEMLHDEATRISEVTDTESSTVKLHYQADYDTSYALTRLEQSSDYDSQFTYHCYIDDTLSTIKVFSTDPGDLATACAASPDIELVEKFHQDDLPTVTCRYINATPGEAGPDIHFCEFPLLDSENRTAMVITRRRQGAAIVENLNPNDGELILVEERIYAPLADTLEQEFIIPDEEDNGSVFDDIAGSSDDDEEEESENENEENTEDVNANAPPETPALNAGYPFILL
ncbi:hypothetical protein [Hahella ganghwensis]|uniref:hypothetical protein n=1 Tax=Hahella ganghwensis TaxID=286420 RepID=UPI0003757BBE|nr:hypothetical protein [Hahella ganghwensis]